jgi:hypothetical protein
VWVVASDHPLAGRALRARHAYRRYGRLWLVLVLPDGGVTSVEVGHTDVLDAEPVLTALGGTSTLSSEGVRRLLGLLQACLERIALDADRRAGGDDHDA